MSDLLNDFKKNVRNGFWNDKISFGV
jgi:hypothetical protein